MKLRCVVCSTQVEVLKSMEMLLENTNLVNSVTCYSTLEEIKDELRDGKEADILFIDVCAEEEKCFENDKEKNEIDFVCELRNVCPSLQIIYLADAHSEWYAQTIFLTPVQPAGFLIKPVREDYINKLLLLAMERQKKETQGRIIVSGKTRRTFYSWEILYLESKAHITLIHTVNGTVYECRDKISDMEKQVGEKFVRCHQSFLVNLQYVECLNKEKQEHSGKKSKTDVLVLNTQDKVVISKKRYLHTKNSFERYLGNKKSG